MCASVRLSWIFALLLIGLVVPASAQTTGDTLSYELEPIVVTADRSARLLSTATSAVSVITQQELRQMPLRTVADALTLTPGFAFLQLDGLGHEPQATVRGFYGGGEAEYIVLLVDGRPVNGMERGLINWNLLPKHIEAIEVVRGGSSSLYGDAAIGGVVNIITSGKVVPGTQISLAGGSYGTLETAISRNGVIGNKRYTVSLSGAQTDGYRNHAERRYLNLGGTVDLRRNLKTLIRFSTRNNIRSYDVPGPITEDELAASRDASSLFYAFDNTDEQFHQATIDVAHSLGLRTEFTASVTGEFRDVDAFSTLVLAPGFADTKNRTLQTNRLLTTAQFTFDPLPLPIESQLVIGADATMGRFETEYFDAITGGEDDYTAVTRVSRGTLHSLGDGRRNSLALYAQYDVRPLTALRLSVGARYDTISDQFTPNTDPKKKATHTAFSPKAGVNLRYLATAQHVGHLYANVSKSFKTATMDQLFDLRTIPVPFPPFQVSLSNHTLKPQTGVGFEVGLYHRFIPHETFSGSLSLALYQIDMKEELDFDLATLTYRNLGKSRHQGLEAGLKLYGPRTTAAFFNYTYQDVTLEFGDNKGNHVKAIPQDHIVAGFGIGDLHGFGIQAKLNATRRIFLDDSNTITLPDFTTLDLKLTYQVRMATLALNLFNAMDEAYSTTGFPLADFTGGSTLFLYPAAGRQIQLGVTIDL